MSRQTTEHYPHLPHFTFSEFIESIDFDLLQKKKSDNRIMLREFRENIEVDKIGSVWDVRGSVEVGTVQQQNSVWESSESSEVDTKEW